MISSTQSVSSTSAVPSNLSPEPILDTGFQTSSIGRCASETHRTVKFAAGTPEHIVDAFAEELRGKLWGQIQYVRQDADGLTLHAYCLIDSSD